MKETLVTLLGILNEYNVSMSYKAVTKGGNIYLLWSVLDYWHVCYCGNIEGAIAYVTKELRRML